MMMRIIETWSFSVGVLDILGILTQCLVRCPLDLWQPYINVDQPSCDSARLAMRERVLCPLRVPLGNHSVRSGSAAQCTADGCRAAVVRTSHNYSEASSQNPNFGYSLVLMCLLCNKHIRLEYLLRKFLENLASMVEFPGSIYVRDLVMFVPGSQIYT